MFKNHGLPIVITRTLLGATILFFGMNDYHQILGEPALSEPAINFLNSLNKQAICIILLSLLSF